MNAGSSAEILTHVEPGGVGVITLNRPAKINALTDTMLGAIEDALDRWEDDDGIVGIVLHGTGDRGFCAGGDIASIHGHGRDDPAASIDVWHREYRGVLRLSRFRTPIVSLLDGLAMGAGIGLGGHVSLRVVTERSVVGMPETLIGLTPDAGGSFLLSRAPGELGTHLALTGRAMSGADALVTGFADVFVPATVLPDIPHALATGGLDGVRALAVAPPMSELDGARVWIDEAYRGDDALAIVARLRALEATGIAEAGRSADDIEAASPTSVVVTLAAQRRARALPDLESVLGQELGLVSALAGQHDLYEGIRARVIDKDRRPAWSPATLDAVDVDAVLARIDWDAHL
ncbi:enoyl-CoA hydratase/isomerase family protein [Frigoribacterium sp. 2-23]|uniref:enoyl-CoA hydratase/isomerase family protein n=1 Tax=Frigoribacterium sp. 2-23 TaxID=3415006 RepID=UPI003C6EACE6